MGVQVKINRRNPLVLVESDVINGLPTHVSYNNLGVLVVDFHCVRRRALDEPPKRLVAKELGELGEDEQRSKEGKGDHPRLGLLFNANAIDVAANVLFEPNIRMGPMAEQLVPLPALENSTWNGTLRLKKNEKFGDLKRRGFLLLHVDHG